MTVAAVCRTGSNWCGWTSSVTSDRAELILTLLAENAHHAEQHALALVKATGHRPIRVDVLLAETYDRETSGRHDDSAGRRCDPTTDAQHISAK